MSMFVGNAGLQDCKSDNIIHFQDPRSAKYNGALQKPLTQTTNKRNDTSYNFINGEAKNPPKQKLGKKILSQQNSPQGQQTVMKGLIQNNDKGKAVNDENRPPTSILRYNAG